VRDGKHDAQIKVIDNDSGQMFRFVVKLPAPAQNNPAGVSIIQIFSSQIKTGLSQIYSL
jgi:hypothetical protein